jgi:hypothetical protein
MRWLTQGLLPAAFLWFATAPPFVALAQEMPSLLEIPVQLDLGPAFGAAESLVPHQTGGPHWEDWHGFKVRYQAWRGPLLMEMRGDVLLAQAHVRYRAEGRKDLIGSLGVGAGCGIEEPPRQALIGAAIRLSVAPDWSLRPAFQVMPTRFIDRCEITALDIDVSPLVERAFQKRLRQALLEALHEVTPALDALKVGAARVWSTLQAPRDLGSGLWLAARPIALGMSPPIGHGRQLSTRIGIAMQPLLSSTEPAPTALRPLPPLSLFRPGRTGLAFDLALNVSVADLSSAVARKIAGQSVQAGGFKLVVEDAELSAADSRLVLKANIGGDTDGLLEVRGRPAIDTESGRIGFADLDFAFETMDPEAEVMLAIFYEQIRERLQNMANEALTGRLDAARAGLQAELDAWLSGGGRVDFSDVALTALEMQVVDQRVGLRGRAGGVVRVILAPGSDD